MIETKTFNYGITCSFDYLVSILSLLCKAIRSSKKDGSEKVTTNLSLYKKAKDNEVGVLQVLINGEIQQEIPVYKAITPKVESQSWFDKLMNWFTGAVSF